MEYRSRVPGEPLEGVVALIFHLKGYRPEHSIERVVPDGSSTIVVELDGQTRWTVSNQTHQRLRAYRDAWLSGPHRNFFSITSLADTELIGIRFTETGLFSLLGRSVEEFTDRIVDAEPHLPHSPSTLRKGLVRATTSEEKFDLVESWLVRSSEPAVRPPRALRKAISICQNADQPIRWSRVASEVGYSQKTFLSENSKGFPG